MAVTQPSSASPCPTTETPTSSSSAERVARWSSSIRRPRSTSDRGGTISGDPVVPDVPGEPRARLGVSVELPLRAVRDDQPPPPRPDPDVVPAGLGIRGPRGLGSLLL